jgi:phospholipase C
MAGPSKDNAFDHIVVVMFENRSFDNLAGSLVSAG